VGTEEEKLQKFREVRGQILQRIKSWLAELKQDQANAERLIDKPT